MTGKEKGMDLRKRWLAILTTICMLASLAPTGVFAASSGSAASQAAAAENSAVSPVSAETYSDLGLSRDVSGEKLVSQKQPYGNDVTGSVVATNVINELYVNFNGSIHYGWSILDEIPMQYRKGSDAKEDWQSSSNFYGAMGYWRPNQRTVKYSNGSKSVGALYAKDGNAPSGSPNSIGESISSNNKHLTNQYNLAEAFSPGTGKDNYVAQMRLDYKNDVYLEIYSVAKGKSGKYENKCVASVKAGNDANAGDKDHIIYNYEYDAMYDLATGDIDGDGYDEIALYFGNRVYLYSYKTSSLKRVQIYGNASFLTIRPDNIGTVAPKFKSSIVTLAFGDINADGKDELAVAQTLPYTSGTGSEYVRILSTNKDGAVMWLTAIDDRNLGDGTLRYANVATGDINGDNVDELIIAGYVSTGGRNQVCSKNKIYYKVIDKNIIDSLVKDGNADIGSWKSVDFKLNDYLGRVVDNKNEMIPPVSLVCAATQGMGYADQVFMGGCLYSYDTSKGELNYLTRMTMNREYKQDGGEKKNKEDMFVLNAVAGNFDGNAHGQEQIICALGMRAEDRDNYWYDIAYINKMYPGDSDTGEDGYWYGQEQVMNYESSYNHDSNKDRASLYLSLAAVDCDDDSTLMRYKSKNVTYSKPEVYTVLQSAPYFKDLEENRGYLNQSETSYGKSSSDGTIITSGGKVTAGMYMSFSQDISVFGVKIASFEAEGQYTHTFSHEFDYEETVTESIAYSASAGDDYAVVYTVPYMDYQYQVWVPKSTVPSNNYDAWLTDFLKNSYGKNDNGSYKWDSLSDTEKNTAIAESKTVVTPGSTVGGYWDDCVISIPMTPKTVILTVDAYDEIAARTAGLEPIRGNVLNSEAGYPATYKYYSEYGSDSFRAIGQEQMVTNAEGSYITIEGSKETVYENEFKYDFDVEGRVGVGAAGMTVGVIGGFGFGVGGGVISSSSKSYSATVDNLPADASAYTFNWKFGTRKAKLNGNDLLILEYRTSNVQQLPSPPSDLRVESVTTDSVSLGWTAVPGAVNYRIYQIDKNTGMQFLMAAVPGSATSYTDDQLNPNTTYTYSIQSVMANNASSILTKEVTASTLSNSMSDFTISKHPEDTSTFVSGNATFEVEAQCLGADGKPYTLHYQWQKYNENSREWEVCDMQENGYAQYTHKNVNISDAGTKYRCLVYVNAKLYIMSLPAELSIGRAKSSIAFSASSGGTDLTNGSSVKSSYTKSEIRDVKDAKDNIQYNEVPVTEVIDSKTYTLYTYSTAGDGSGTVTLYNDGSGNYYIKDSSGTLSKLTISNEPQSLSYRETTGSGDAAVSTDKNVPWSSLVKDTAYTAGSKSFYVDKDGNVVASSTTGATAYKASEKYDVTENGAVTVSFYKCSITETIEGSSSTVTYDSWFAVTDAGAGEKQYNAVLTTNDILKNGSVSIDIDDIKLKTEQQKMTQTVDVQVDGDKVVMSAAVTGRQDRMPTGYITFSMSSADGTDIQKITATVGSDGKATEEWKPSVSGTYTLKAEYEGDDCFKASTSGSVTINVITPNERKLTLSGMNMTYGDDPQILQLIMLDGNATGEVSSKVIKASDVLISYEGKRVYGLYDILDSGNSGIRFTPDKAGVYSITATYEDNGNVMTVTKNITVYKRNVTIVAGSLKTPLGTAVARDKLTYTIDGAANADKALFNTGVTLSCDGINADAKGQFPINITFTASMAITEKYNVSVRAGTLDVVEYAYLVNNETSDANGTVKLTYSVGNVTLDVKKGEIVPKGAKVTAKASPAEGYKVKCWYIKEGSSGSEYHPVYQGGSTGAFDTSNTLVISDSLDKEYSVKAEFELAYYKLDLWMSYGSITARYLSSSGTAGESFSSGSKVNPIQKIQLTAVPD
ncbi:MAG: Ig-like domain repeat protein, partial [Firmicutes bacterium]|nr:Ig-like domain repeat protein [Bacillota bacterium]